MSCSGKATSVAPSAAAAVRERERAIDVRAHGADGGVDVGDRDADEPHASPRFAYLARDASTSRDQRRSEATQRTRRAREAGSGARAAAAGSASICCARVRARAIDGRRRRRGGAAAPHRLQERASAADGAGSLGERDEIVIGEAPDLELARAASPCRCLRDLHRDRAVAVDDQLGDRADARRGVGRADDVLAHAEAVDELAPARARAARRAPSETKIFACGAPSSARSVARAAIDSGVTLESMRTRRACPAGRLDRVADARARCRRCRRASSRDAGERPRVGLEEARARSRRAARRVARPPARRSDPSCPCVGDAPARERGDVRGRATPGDPRRPGRVERGGGMGAALRRTRCTVLPPAATTTRAAFDATIDMWLMQPSHGVSISLARSRSVRTWRSGV